MYSHPDAIDAQRRIFTSRRASSGFAFALGALSVLGAALAAYLLL